MSRPLRIPLIDGWYHITARGNDRQLIYRNNRDREHFLELVGRLGERFGVVLLAYVLMPNHFHLLLRTPRANLSHAMQWLNLSYSVWHNRRHRRSGHLFEGRFHSALIEAEGSWALTACDYIHLNPIRLKALQLSRPDRAARAQGWLPPPTSEEIASWLEALRAYKWSSFRAYAGYGPAIPWLSLELLERMAGKNQNPAAIYRQRLEAQIRQGVNEPFTSQLQVRVLLGSAAFVARLKGSVAGDEQEQPGAKALRGQVPVADIRASAATVKGEPWDQFAQRHGDWGRDLALAAAQRWSGLTLREIGRAFDGLNYPAVSAGIRRFECRKAKERAVQRAWIQMANLLKVQI